MASIPSTDDFRHTPPSHLAEDEPPFFRYCLRDLLVYTAFLCLVLAGMVLTKGMGAVAVLLVALVIAAHVLSTAIGSRLRERSIHGWNHESWDGDFADSPLDAAFLDDHSTFCLPRPSLWYRCGRIGHHRLPLLVLGGVLLGGAAGGLLFRLIGDRTSVAGNVVGAISFAVLGGWFAFLATNFYQIFRHGWNEAVAEPRPDEWTTD